MHDNQILNLDAAAKLVQATAETLLQYIRKGDLKAARVGKHFVITYAALISFIDALSARQSLERCAKHAESDEAKLDKERYDPGRTFPKFVYLPKDGTPSLATRRKGRRRQLPALLSPEP